MNKYGGINDLQGYTYSPSHPKHDPLKRNIYNTWYDMLRRVYGEQTKENRNASYKDCTIDPEWLLFSNFVRDFEQLDGYDDFIKTNGYGFSLDKDMTLKGNKHYSKLTCKIISTSINVSESNTRTKSMKICAVDLQTKEKFFFKSIKEAGMVTGYNCSSIGLHVKNGQPYRGYLWIKKEGEE